MVNRFGEFTPVGRLFFFGKKYRSSPNLFATFCTVKVAEKRVGLQFGRFFHKLIRLGLSTGGELGELCTLWLLFTSLFTSRGEHSVMST
jgi:hypothetical protein